MQFDIKKLVRPNIEQLKPYSSAKDEFTGEAHILLDANENSLGSPLTKWYNRYPDPYQKEIKEKLSFIKKVPASQIFLGNGSDEIIDLLFTLIENVLSNMLCKALLEYFSISIYLFL